MYHKKLMAVLMAAALCVQPAVPAMAAGPEEAQTQVTVENGALEDGIPETSQQDETAGAENHPEETNNETANEPSGETEDAFPIEETVSEEGMPAAEGAEADISLYEDQDLTFTGYEVRPFLRVKYGKDTLSEGTGYEVEFEDNINAGLATAHVKGIDGYDFEKDITFEIAPHVLTEEDVQTSLGKYDLRYNKHAYGRNTYLVAIGGKILEKGIDYTVEGEDAFLDSTSGATAVITGTGNCTGEVTIRVPEYDPMVVDITGDFVYGEDPEPIVSVNIGNRSLTQGSQAGDGDYYVKSTFTSERIVQVEVIGEYDGAEIYEYKSIRVNPYTLSGSDVSIEKQEYGYTGSPVKPAVTVTAGGKTLEEGTDYAIQYKDNIKKGTASVTVTGTGNYTGTVTKTFTITGPVSQTVSVTAEFKGNTAFVYDGKEKKPDVTVRADGSTLNSGYTVTYSDNINAGTGKAVVSGTYNGTGFQKTLSFTISPKTFSEENVEIRNVLNDDPLVISCDGVVLAEGADYVLVREDNTSSGTVKITVTGKKNYKGSVAKTFTIKEKVKKITPGVTLSPASFVYNGKAQKPKVTVKDGSTVLKTSDYDIKWPASVNAGTYKVAVTLKGNYSGTASAAYRINPKKTVPKVILSSSSFTYNGKTQRPKVTVKDGSTVLKTTDYSIKWPASVNAGTYRATVTLKGNYSGTASAVYRISPKKITPQIALSKTRFVYDGKVKTPAITVRYGKTVLRASDYTKVYAKGRKYVGTYKVTVTLKGNYSGTRTAVFMITPKATAVTAFKPIKNKLAFKLSWKKQKEQVTGYQVQYSTDKNFKKNVRTVTVKGAGNTSTILNKGIKARVYYYARVRTYKTAGGKNYYSEWSYY